VCLMLERVLSYLVVMEAGDRFICTLTWLVKRLCPTYNS
jgi:hypothetical protein